MSLAVVPLRPEHIPEIARICFDAFGDVQDRHGVERDFESPSATQMLIGMLASREDVAGCVAVDRHGGGEEVLGSSFVMCCDAVAGVGPISVKPGAQGKGAGRLLTQTCFVEAGRRGITKVRLMQEAINVASLSLYTRVGFEWRFGVALLRAAPGDKDDPRVERVTTDHLGIIDSVSERGFHDSRVNEVAGFLRHGFPGYILIREESNGRRIVGGYYFPGMLGHGFAATATDLADLIVHAARQTPSSFGGAGAGVDKVLVPLDQHELYRTLMDRGCRTIKVFNYMSFGEYVSPIGAWVPSIGM